MKNKTLEKIDNAVQDRWGLKLVVFLTPLLTGFLLCWREHGSSVLEKGSVLWVITLVTCLSSTVFLLFLFSIRGGFQGDSTN